jgi:non-canonical poly(A) RNA polymerase PAPD5/7
MNASLTAYLYSDIDLVIFSDSMAYSDKNSYLRGLARTIQHARLTDKVTIISKARVPIVKFVTTGAYGRFKVDISVNQRSGILSGQIMNGFLRDLNPAPSLALRALILLSKAFLLQRSLNEVYTGGLGSYSIVCLAVSFLQMHPKIRRGELDPDRNLGVILMEFFELYGVYFNYNNVGISVRHGGTYYNKRVRGWYDGGKPAGLSIEDPADPCRSLYLSFRTPHANHTDTANDIASGSFGFAKVRTTFAGAHNILAATAFQRAAAMKARSSGKRHDMGSSHESWSILSSIITISQEVTSISFPRCCIFSQLFVDHQPS